MTSESFLAGMGDFFRWLVWPARGKLGRVCGTVSILKLYELGFTSGFGSVLGRLLEYYDWLVGRLVWPFEPFIKGWFAYLHQYIGWPEMLYPHWKHIFVLLCLYFVRATWISRSIGLCYVIMNLTMGLFVAFTFGALAGSIPLNSVDQRANFLFAAIFILGAAAYGVIAFFGDAMFLPIQWTRSSHRHVPSRWGYFRWGLSRILSRSLIGLVSAWVMLQIPFIRQTPSPGIAVSVIRALCSL